MRIEFEEREDCPDLALTSVYLTKIDGMELPKDIIKPLLMVSEKSFPMSVSSTSNSNIIVETEYGKIAVFYSKEVLPKEIDKKLIVLAESKPKSTYRYAHLYKMKDESYKFEEIGAEPLYWGRNIEGKN